MTPNPLQLGDNRVPVYYAGGARISAFRRGSPQVDPALDPDGGPEDWVGSLCTLPAAVLPQGCDPSAGLSATADGLLRDLVEADPAGWLGPELAARLDGSAGLLVKLLDAGERLPVHCHPTREFAGTHLSSRFGKTEGWLVLRVEPGAAVWLGFRDPVEETQLRDWIRRQDSSAMLAAMNRVTVEPGQVIYVPAGLPHAIDTGVMVLELQEPTSFSVLAEHAPFGVDADAATLGLGWDRALACFDRTGYADRLDELVYRPHHVSGGPGGRLLSLFPPAGDLFFRALLADSASETGVELPERSFAVVVVTEGAGDMRWDGGRLAVSAGETYAVPFAAGPLRFTGRVRAVACLPPVT